jgi:ribosomal protein S18 acetylase RimI-like enzyme
MDLALPDVRLALPADASRIAGLSREHIEAGLTFRWTPGRVQHAIADRGCNVAVVDARKEIAGFGIMFYGDEAAHLALLAVAPAHRRHGLGRRILSWLEMPARVAGLSELRLEVRADNPDAVAFYRRLGFQLRITIPGYYQGRIDALRMVKPLTAA